MADIASVAALPKAAPAAPVAGVAPAAPTATMADPALALGAGVAGGDFLGQLKAALKSLASAVAAQTTATPLASAALHGVPAAPDFDQVAQATQAEVAPKSTDGADADALPEVLAALGFVLVPTAVPPTFPPSTPTTPTGRQPSAPSAATPALAQAVSPPHMSHSPSLAPDDPINPATAQAAAPSSDGTPVAGRDVDSPETATQTSAPPPPIANQHPRPDASAAPNATLAQASAATLAQASAATSPTATAAATAPRHSEAAATATAVAGASVAPHAQTQPATDFGSGDSSDAGDRRDHSTRRSTVAAEAAPGDPRGAANDPSFATASPTSGAPAAAPPTAAQAQPSQVAAEIAHQAELFRLPGSRGVRIQLHPDDLGGVQVTLRYAASGGIELHINVEHASTGALVQSGWTELRDALATQGISPDRLVMSVTGPSTAGSPDFSSNGGNLGYRSESGLTGFMQDGQPGQQGRGGGDEPRAGRGWNRGSDPISASADDTPRSAAPAAVSRIDYRV